MAPLQRPRKQRGVQDDEKFETSFPERRRRRRSDSSCCAVRNKYVRVKFFHCRNHLEENWIKINSFYMEKILTACRKKSQWCNIAIGEEKRFKIRAFSLLTTVTTWSCHSSSSSHAPGKSLSPDSRYLVTLGSLLDDQHWHHVAVEHHSNHLKLTVDKSTEWVHISPTFAHWDHDQVCIWG